MAGDWIKMRVDLQSHPKVVRILSATRSDKFRVIGGLHAVWTIFDTHSEDGKLKGYTPEALDHVIGWDGFSRAMEAVGWLVFDGLETLAMPEFDSHNGASAKRRAEDQKRKKNTRNSVRNLSAECADDMQTREEKSREEIKAIASPEDQKSKSKPKKTALPADFGISERVKAWAEEKGHIRLAEHLESFKVKAKANGYTYADWDAAFMGAIRDDWAKLNHQVNGVSAPKPTKTRPFL